MCIFGNKYFFQSIYHINSFRLRLRCQIQVKILLQPQAVIQKMNTKYFVVLIKLFISIEGGIECLFSFYKQLGRNLETNVVRHASNINQ